MKRITILVLVLVLGFVGVASIVSETTEARSGGLIYYLAPVLFDEFQAGSKLMIEKYARELGYEIKSLNANNYATIQIDQMDDAITMEPELIILNAVDSATIVSGVDKARAEGIPVIVYDRFITDTSVDFHSVVGTIKIGEIAAGECVRLLKEKYGEEKGVVLEIMGDPGDMYTVLIDQGFRETMAKYPNTEVIAKTTELWEPTVTANIVDDQLTLRQDIDIIFCHADFRVPAITPILESHGYGKGDIKIIGSDGAPTGLDSIRDGWMIETVAVPMAEQAWGLFEFLDKIIAKEKIKPGIYNIKGIDTELIIEKWGPTLYLPGEIITKENVDNPNLWGNLEVKVEK